MLRWACVICDADGLLSHTFQDGDHADKPQSIRISNLLYHHMSTAHGQMVAKRLGEEADLHFAAPSPQLFKELFRAFQAGDTPTSGYNLPSGMLSFDKANSMLWMLDQASGDKRREHLESAVVINCLRDERHGRMHVRFRCTDKLGNFHSGYLGQSRGHASDALGLTKATIGVYRRACTSRAHPPKGALLKPSFHESIFRSSKDSTEAVSIDSAENEVVSANDMSKPLPDGGEPPFPNCDHILRDAAHSARRVLSRLWKADEFLDYVYRFFMLVASIIQWSDDLRKLYQECTAESSDSAVGATFSHMRAAKHRIETWLTPLSRACLDPTGEHIFKSCVCTLSRASPLHDSVCSNAFWSVSVFWFPLVRPDGNKAF